MPRSLGRCRKVLFALCVLSATANAALAVEPALLAMAPAPVPQSVPVDHRLIQYRPHPCQDGRFSDGQPRSCEELMRWLESGEYPAFWHGPRDRPDPCTDGRFNDGRPRSCEELMRWLHRAR